MAATVVHNDVLIHNADSTTGWYANNGFSMIGLETAGNIEGAGGIFSRTPSNGAVSWLSYNGAGLPADFTGLHIRMWGFAGNPIDTFVNGGFRLRVSSTTDGSTDYGEWDVGGSDKGIRAYAGWFMLVADCDRAFDRTVGTPPALNNIASISMVQNVLDANGKEIPIGDAAFYSSSTANGLTVTGGTSVSPATLKDIGDADRAGGYGVFKEAGSIFYCNGKLILGDAGTASSIIRDSGQIVIFEDLPVSLTHYVIDCVGNATATDNEISFGTEVGTPPNSIGSNGVTFKAAGTGFTLNATDPNLNICDFLGCTIDGAIAVNWTNPNARFISGIIANSGLITLSGGAQMRDMIISNTTEPATSAAIKLTSNPTDPEFRNIIIQNCTRGILLQGTGNATYDLRNITFIGNTVDIRIDYGAGDTVTLNILEGGSVPTIDNVNGSTIIINNAVTLSVHCEDESGANVVGARVAIYDAANIAEGQDILNTVTDANGNVSTTYNYTGDLPIVIRIRHSTTGTRYYPVNTTGTITANGFTLDVVLTEDKIVGA